MSSGGRGGRWGGPTRDVLGDEGAEADECAAPEHGAGHAIGVGRVVCRVRAVVATVQGGLDGMEGLGLADDDVLFASADPCSSRRDSDFCTFAWTLRNVGQLTGVPTHRRATSTRERVGIRAPTISALASACASVDSSSPVCETVWEKKRHPKTKKKKKNNNRVTRCLGWGTCPRSGPSRCWRRCWW